MANEIQIQFTTAVTLYANVRNSTSGMIWNGSAFEAYNSASGNQNSYVVALTEQGTASQYYVGSFPAAIAPGVYNVAARQRVNAWYAETDTPVGAGEIQWTGSGGIVRPLSDLATSGQLALYAPVRLTRGVAISGFMFKLVSSADHSTPFTSGVCSGQVLRSDGSYGALQSGTAVGDYREKGGGMYSVNLTSGDLNGDVVALRFAAVGVSGGSSDNRDLVIYMQRTSGQQVT